MENNYFKNLYNIDVKEYIEKKGKFFYLSWAHAVKCLKENHPNATWEVQRFGENQLPFQRDESGCYVEVAVNVNHIILSQIHPVLDNYNKPIKNPDSFQINTSIQRCLAKAIALHGLGLSIYAGEDLPPDQVIPVNQKPIYEKEIDKKTIDVKKAHNDFDDIPF